MYKWYRETFKDKKTTWGVFSNVCKDFNNEMMRLILGEGFKFYIPHGLGMVTVVKRNKIESRSKRQIDWQASKRLGKHIFHENEHTNGWNYRFLWRRYGYNFKNKTLYIFRAVRSKKRQLAAILKDPNRSMDYIDTVPEKKINIIRKYF